MEKGVKEKRVWHYSNGKWICSVKGEGKEEGNGIFGVDFGKEFDIINVDSKDRFGTGNVERKRKNQF